MNNSRIITNAIKYCNKKGLDYQNYDFESIIDNSLTYSENMSAIRKLIGIEEEPNKKRIEHIEEELNEKITQEIEQKINSIQVKPRKSCKAYYKPIYTGIEKIKLGYSILFFVKGRGGLGKSFHIEQALKEYGVEYLEIHKLTEAIFPEILFKNHNKVIWIKDAVKIFNNATMLDLVKACCETKKESNGKYMPRKITIMNYSNQLRNAGVPREFYFEGALVFDYNSIIHSKHYEDYNALLSRGEYIELIFSKEEMSNLMRKIASTSFEKEVTEFLIENYVFVGQNQFNLRTQQKAFSTAYFCKETNRDWKEGLKEELAINQTPTRCFLYQVMGKKPIKTKELKKFLLSSGYVQTMRTADRRIKEWEELEEIYKITGEERNYLVSLDKEVKDEDGTTSDTTDTKENKD